MNLVNELTQVILEAKGKQKRLPYDQFMIERDRLMKLFRENFRSSQEVHPDRFTLELEAPGNVTTTAIAKKFTKLPLKFGKVFGDFDVVGNDLVTLEGAPYFVGRRFDVHRNKLTSLKHGPQMVMNDYDASDNQLSDLMHSPELIEGDFHVQRNPLKSLKGFPKQVKGTVGLPYDKSRPYGLLKLPTYDIAKGVYFEPVDNTEQNQKEADVLFKLVQARRNMGRAGVLKLQTALIEAGLDAWSKYE